MEIFKKEVLAGLQKSHKTLSSKYFYDDEGSRIFQEIMDMPEYYLPAAEMEIIERHSQVIAQKIAGEELDIVELGAGDGRKISHFLKVLHPFVDHLTYFPLDISQGILEENTKLMAKEVRGIKIEAMWGDFFISLPKIRDRKTRRVLIFAGSNIGNFKRKEAEEFLQFIDQELKTGDNFILGVDLKKNPRKILAAYDDPHGITKRFNLNLLNRINKELGGDFELESFDHYGTYHPITGAAESFLVSLKDQKVRIGDEVILFQKDEVIQTEISQKFDLPLLMELSKNVEFRIDSIFSDSSSLFSWVLFRK
ncbi:L-histidine N(alpha)-methyltransferase [Algoriphagus litoralis]|uniref:L-histidine N(alpha)-methyltransferase n=1 Tax=Algoriphagus litoralis TaxID=2202829 RepID=UPI000DB8FD90|nr:L-histidine N(alpha)-methyltransferase [Algoriphagus litoralis]